MHLYAYLGQWHGLTEAARRHGCAQSTLIERADRGEVDRKLATDLRAPKCPCCKRSFEPEPLRVAPQAPGRLYSQVPIYRKKKTFAQIVLEFFCIKR